MSHSGKSHRAMCRLCREEKELVNSHILSEFLYKDCYDKNHHNFSTLSIVGDRNLPKQRKGYREHLLCRECELKLSVYEGYGADTLSRARSVETQGDEPVQLGNFKYANFKLFGLANLWRSHESNLYMFEDINLGPHAEKIRVMLETDDAGTPGKYRFNMLKLTGDPDLMGLLLPPARGTIDKENIFRFTAKGFQFSFNIASHNNPLVKIPYVGQTDDLVIPVITTNFDRVIKGLRR